MRINNNIPANAAFNALNSTNISLQKTIQKLSTGLHINSSADDAAGFAISERIRSQISGLNVATRNAYDGVSLLQTAEGALGETNSMLQRMRELCVQATNDTLTSTDRKYIQLEIDELKGQIDRIAKTTQFNNKHILDGSSGAMWSSSDMNLKARINGGLVTVDEFGQKVNHEGNFRIEVTAEPGKAQVQKSNIMTVAEYGMEVEMHQLTEPITQKVYEISYVTETVTELVRVPTVERITTIEEVPHIIRINEGVDSINETSGDGWAFENGSLVITGSGTYDIRGTEGADPASTPNIIVKAGARAEIFLTDVHIDKSGTTEAAFEIEAGAYAEVVLTNSNTLKSGNGRAGLEVPDGATLLLASAEGEGKTSGSLKAEGGEGAAGIGGPGIAYSPRKGRAGSIDIWGGTIEAKGARGGAGIGGGDTGGSDGGGTISIHGGRITAWGGSVAGAGIGSGYWPGWPDRSFPSDDTLITIYNVDSLAAYGGSGGAGIGGARNSSAGNIRINKQLFDENRIDAAAGGTGAEHIGWGANGNNADNNINLDGYFDDGLGYYVPDRPTIEIGVETELPIDTYEEVTRTVTREVTREVVKQVDKVVGERVVDTIPIIHGLNGGDFVFKEKKLGEISQFHNASGVSLVSQPQTITITQGDGKTADVIIYETDTMQDAAKKINDAIANSLGQAKYTDNREKFCTIADGTENTSESVYVKEPIYSKKGYLSEYGFDIPEGTLIGYKVSSTMLVRSAIPGKAGELYFSGDEDLLHALGLNTIQESSESTLTASVYDAHSDKIIAQNVKASGSEFVGLIPPEIDIEVDCMAGLKSSWDDKTKQFMCAAGDVYSAMLHLKNNGTIFQTGANQGEDFIIDLGDTSCDALNLSGVNVVTRESAARSIGILDRAINRISAQRSKVGAYENGLEHVMNNLTTTANNLLSADSRLRDADMALTMMNFAKLQILNQSGTSMLSQANQIPQSVMTLMQ